MTLYQINKFLNLQNVLTLANYCDHNILQVNEYGLKNKEIFLLLTTDLTTLKSINYNTRCTTFNWLLFKRHTGADYMKEGKRTIQVQG